MKPLKLLLAAAALSCGAMTAADFHLRCEIDGLQPGDTLFCESSNPIYFKHRQIDTIPVTEAGKADADITIGHPVLAVVYVHNAKGELQRTCYRGAELLANPGDTVTLRSTLLRLGAAQLSGGWYEKPFAAELSQEEAKLANRLIDVYVEMEKYRNPENPDSLKKYSALYNSLHSQPRLRQLRDSISEQIDNDPFAAFFYARNLYEVKYAELKERLSQYTPEIRESYVGQLLETHLHTLENIAVGNAPRNFTLRDKDGKERSLTDYHGKYLMVYYWGMCPGTFWANPQIVELYEKYHSKGFDILGLTETDWSGNEYYMANDYIAGQVKSLSAHAWPTVYTEEPENEYIVDELYLCGVPMIMLINPEGKTVAQGFFDDNAELIKETLTKLD